MPDAERGSGCGAARSKWSAVTPKDARWFVVPHSSRSRARAVTALRDLPVGVPVVLCDTWPLSRQRCRKLAARAGVCVVREYLALPSLRTAVVLVQDTPTTARYVASRLLAAPPTSSWQARLEAAALPLARWVLSTSSRSAVFGGRLVLGART